MSATRRQLVWDWYVSTARIRLGPGGSVIVVHTRWYVDDLAGRLLQASKDGTGEKFELYSLPAIALEG